MICATKVSNLKSEHKGNQTVGRDVQSRDNYDAKKEAETTKK